jgi:hypothetical protein
VAIGICCRQYQFSFCEPFGIIAVGRDPRTNALHNDPLKSAIEESVGENVLPAAATAASIEQAIRRHYYGESPKAQPDAGAAGADALPGGAEASQPQLAALPARIEQLEQQTSARDNQILQVLGSLETC